MLNETLETFDKWQQRGIFYANQSRAFLVCSSSFESFSMYWNARYEPYRLQSAETNWGPMALWILSFASNLPG